VNDVRQAIEASISTKQQLLEDDDLLRRCGEAVDLMVAALSAGNKVLFCGNGGSAADAQHLSAELSGRYAFDRPPLYSEALHVNSSYVTAVANDYGYDVVFSRMLAACGRPGDVLVCLTTSGNSANVVRAAEEAERLGIHVVSLTGEGGGKLAALSTILLDVPSTETPRIQECHILLGHTMCGLVESALFDAPEPPA
jgi:D-sedoheptulose 7-phosphate isomerase